jgi:signal transduction histidine kinase
MDAGALRQPFAKLRLVESRWLAPIIVATGYFLGAHAAFLVGTLSDRIFAPFWPPNAILFCGLLLTRPNRWAGILAAVFPAHLLAESYVGMSATAMIWAYVTNCTVAIVNALVLRRLSTPPWFGSMRNAGIYIASTAGIVPAIVALAGAFVPILGGAAAADYPYYWVSWYVGNALACLTIGHIILVWSEAGGDNIWSVPWLEAVEALLFVVGLIVASLLSLYFAGHFVESAFRPAILYAPLLIVLWGSARFGEKGASVSILVLTMTSIWMTLNGHSPFVAATAEKSVVALQLFIFGIAIPVILFSAAIDRLRAAKRTTHKLVNSVLAAQDGERRRIARELHDSTAQNLVGANLMIAHLTSDPKAQNHAAMEEIGSVLQQSIQELRLLSQVLHPPRLEERGLRPALEQYVAGFIERSGIQVDLAIADSIGRLPSEIELVLYRVIQEALTNVERHSGSKTASIRLKKRKTRTSDTIVLAVEDKGRGMPAGQVRSHNSMKATRGIGLESMRERVEDIGGSLKVSSTSGGMLVSAIVPLAGN